ncbi:MAG TPA: hypothetical protein VIY73_15420 [Polyangiaceae bacterium]
MTGDRPKAAWADAIREYDRGHGSRGTMGPKARLKVKGTAPAPEEEKGNG